MVVCCINKKQLDKDLNCPAAVNVRFFIRIYVAVARVEEPCAFLLYIDPDQILLFYRSGNNIVVVANFLHYISL